VFERAAIRIPRTDIGFTKPVRNIFWINKLRHIFKYVIKIK